MEQTGNSDIGPNKYRLPTDMIPPGRETEIQTIEHALSTYSNICIVGEMMTGKTTLLRHCAETELGQRAGIYISLEGNAGYPEVIGEIDHARKKKANGSEKQVVYIDEFGIINFFSDTDRRKLYDYMKDEQEKKSTNWVIACNIPLSDIDPSFEALFPTSIKLTKSFHE